MQGLYPKLREADVWVFGRLFILTEWSGTMKMMDDWVLSFFLCGVSQRSLRHARRKEARPARCARLELRFWETDNFDPLLVHMKAFCRTLEENSQALFSGPAGKRSGVAGTETASSGHPGGRGGVRPQLAQEGKMSRRS